MRALPLGDPINWTDGMNYLLRGKLVSIRDLGAPCLAAIECLAFVEEFGACPAVDCAIDTTTAEERLVGGVDNRVNSEGRDVLSDDRDLVVVSGIRRIESIVFGDWGE